MNKLILIGVAFVAISVVKCESQQVDEHKQNLCHLIGTDVKLEENPDRFVGRLVDVQEFETLQEAKAKVKCRECCAKSGYKHAGLLGNEDGAKKCNCSDNPLNPVGLAVATIFD